MSRDKPEPMRCAICNTAYPWEEQYWPEGKLWAKCWRCTIAEATLKHEAGIERARRRAWVLLFVGVLIGFVVVRVLRALTE